MAGMIWAEETYNPTDNEVFVATDRGRAAIEAAGKAVAAVVQGQGVRRVGVELWRDEWDADIVRDEYVSQEALVIYLLAGPMARYACGFAEYEPFNRFQVFSADYSEEFEAIEFWEDCPLRACPQSEDNDDDELAHYENDCLFELFKIRALCFLKQPNRNSAILALARELLTREEVPADEATALIQRHLASA